MHRSVKEIPTPEVSSPVFQGLERVRIFRKRLTLFLDNAYN